MKFSNIQIYSGAIMLLLFVVSIAFLSCAYKAQEAGGISRYYDKDKPAASYKMAKKKSNLTTGRSLVDDEAEESPLEERKERDIKRKAKERLVIYVARFSIDVESVKRSMNKINNIISRFNGFIESAVTSDSYRYAKVVIRIPVKDFDNAIKFIERIGNITDKSVTASDVTMEYNDIALRLKTAKRVRQRMYELLKRVKKVKERVKILREIERLTTIIDSLTSRMNYLKNRASYSTIILRIRARVKDVVRQYIPSPFPWIAKLDPYRRTIFDDGDDVSFEKPEGFFQLTREFYNKKSSKLLFVTPDQETGIRIGVVENYPPADLKFWDESFKIDLQNRMYKIISKDGLKGKDTLPFSRSIIKLSSGIFYLIAFAVSDNRIIVIEATFADEKNYKNNKSSVEKFIRSAGLKK